MTGSRTLIVAVCALIVLSGCPTHDQVWRLSVDGDADTVDGHAVFDGSVELGGMYGGVTVHDVRVVFVAADNTTIKSIPVGQFNTTDRIENLAISLDQKPQYVKVLAGHIESPKDARYDFSGLMRTENGDYRTYYQETTTEQSSVNLTVADAASMEGQYSTFGIEERSTIEFRNIDLING